jgi:hypothetical protein
LIFVFINGQNWNRRGDIFCHLPINSLHFSLALRNSRRCRSFVADDLLCDTSFKQPFKSWRKKSCTWRLIKERERSLEMAMLYSIVMNWKGTFHRWTGLCLNMPQYYSNLSCLGRCNNQVLLF